MRFYHFGKIESQWESMTWVAFLTYFAFFHCHSLTLSLSLSLSLRDRERERKKLK